MTKPHSIPQHWKILRPILRLEPLPIASRLAILAIHLIFIGGGYWLVLQMAASRGFSIWDSHSGIDDLVPPTPWSIWIYTTLYLYFPITLALAPKTLAGLRILLFQLQAQIILSLATWCVFLLCPTEIHIRQQMELAVQDSSPFFQRAFGLLYKVDTPWNAWPSLHVSLSVLMLLVGSHLTTQPGARHTFWSPGIADRLAILIGVVAWLALCWSIMATKQHYFLDIWTGALAGLMTWIAYLRPRLASLIA